MTKYFTFDSLKKANKKSKSYDLNRTLNDKFFKQLDKTKVYPISFSMSHNDDHMRVRFIHNDHGAEISGEWVDITLQDYDALPST